MTGAGDIERFIDGFLAGDGEAANRPEFEELAVIVAMTYAESAWERALKDGSRCPPRPKLAKKDEHAVVDVILSRSYPGERLDVSLARLAKAVQSLGFPSITAFSATAAYNTFPHLSETPYVQRRKRAVRIV